MMLSLFFLYHLFMATQGTTTNERAKRSDFLFHFENKLEYLQKWKEDFSVHDVHERDRKRFVVDPNWTLP